MIQQEDQTCLALELCEQIRTQSTAWLSMMMVTKTQWVICLPLIFNLDSPLFFLYLNTLSKTWFPRSELPSHALRYEASPSDQLCYGVFSLQVVHRDLKPGNVLIAASRKVRITDFDPLAPCIMGYHSTN